MRFKCPECEAEMSLKEDKHLCESCGKEITLDEAKTLFEEGGLIGIVEESEADEILENANKDEDIVVTNLDEDIAALTEGEKLSEEFKEKAATIIEAAVTSRVAAAKKELVEEYDNILKEAIEKEKEELTKEIDGYLDYVVSEWIENNRPAVESGIKAKMNESFVEGLAELLKEHYVKVPEDRWDIVEGLNSKVEELEEKLDSEIESAISLKSELFEAQKKLAFVELTEGLADTQVEKLAELTENVEAENLEEYKEKVTTIKESYFKKDGKTDDLEEKDTNTGNPGNSDLMAETLRLLNAGK